MISVIIPTLNEQDYLPLLLNDLSKQHQLADEIIVVDGGSKDLTKLIAQAHAGVIVHTTHKNPGHQRTVGGTKAQGDLLIFLDADVRIPPYFIQKVQSMFARQKLDAACPRYLPITKVFLIKLIFAFFNAVFFWGQQHFPSGAGCGIIVSKKLFTKLKGFDNTLLNDDLDFIYRAGRSGSFTILRTPILVSDRRFQKYGIWRTLGQYLVVSYHFINGSLTKANTLSYPFGTFSKH